VIRSCDFCRKQRSSRVQRSKAESRTCPSVCESRLRPEPRESIWDAFRCRDVYATTGTRMTEHLFDPPPVYLPPIVLGIRS